MLEHVHEALRGFLAQCDLMRAVLGDSEGEEHEDAVRRYYGLAGDAGADMFRRSANGEEYRCCSI
jgi:hypothetical protein